MATCKCGKEMFLIYENGLNQRKWFCPHCLTSANCSIKEIFVWDKEESKMVVDNVIKSKSNKK